MKVQVISRSDEAKESCDYRGAMKITIDGKDVLKISEGEPEDMVLYRDLEDVYEIPDLLKLAYEAGKNGDDFEILESIYSDDI